VEIVEVSVRERIEALRNADPIAVEVAAAPSAPDADQDAPEAISMRKRRTSATLCAVRVGSRGSSTQADSRPATSSHRGRGDADTPILRKLQRAFHPELSGSVLIVQD
jgi:hypothetical protein